MLLLFQNGWKRRSSCGSCRDGYKSRRHGICIRIITRTSIIIGCRRSCGSSSRGGCCGLSVFGGRGGLGVSDSKRTIVLIVETTIVVPVSGHRRGLVNCRRSRRVVVATEDETNGKLELELR